ncbi:MAG: IS200/IS605 family transposase [Planctomycetota bacterium]|nr:IS200/IS605 family transposase [Planctomycetota bacterium]
MAGHVYSEIFLHLNWHTQRSRPQLTSRIEGFVHRHIASKCRTSKGVFFQEIGGTETHIHLALRIEPSVAISELVQGLKGASAHETNEHFGSKVLEWQRGYGVVSFGRRQLPWVLEYVRNQKSHHAKGTCQARLEATKEEEVQEHSVGEDETSYPV